MYTPVPDTEMHKPQPRIACNSSKCSLACTTSTLTRQTSRHASAAYTLAQLLSVASVCKHALLALSLHVATAVSFEGRFWETNMTSGMGTAFSNDRMGL